MIQNKLTHIDEVFKITGYSDRRSVVKFLTPLGIRLLKIGKQYYVSTSELDNLISIKIEKPITPSKKQVKRDVSEQAFTDDLQNYLNEL